LTSEADITKEQIKRYALENAPRYMYPRGIEILEGLPQIGSNKIDRRALSDIAKSLILDI
jgi:acyl-coenzyme A synthetase/AMP-(fatty) acid ligase